MKTTIPSRLSPLASCKVHPLEHKIPYSPIPYIPFSHHWITKPLSPPPLTSNQAPKGSGKWKYWGVLLPTERNFGKSFSFTRSLSFTKQVPYQ